MPNLTTAQREIVAMLRECGLSQVIISANGEHNRYSKRGSNVRYTFDDLSELAEKERPAPKMVQKGMFGE